MKEYLNKIHQGDCLEFMKQLPDNCIDLIIADPPYGIDYQSAWRTDKTEWKPKIANDSKPFVSWIYDAHRVLKDGGRMICFYRWDVQQEFLSEIKTMGLNVKSQIVWDKISHGMGDLRGEFAPQHESIIYATKGRYEFQTKRPTTIIQCMRVTPDKLLHPNEKSTVLIKKLIKTLSVKSDIIFDPFMGSGTTAVAAYQIGRRWFGCEISEEYCKIANKRIEHEMDNLFEDVK